ncbi:MAG: Asp-tRNA(Asn)/Glu-tRNA(Gln) amidotransferase subunit GatC [Gammaproteobacteria bacterium]|nr:Asp-tRNA(Asn)/Glu-tRNA(Gln) amidotransferase subunit GatC [Gammaproteobacteria bacterium]
MAINVNEVAHLARLQIEADAIETVRDKLEQIKTLVEHINSVDTSDVTPMSHPFDQLQRLRADNISETDERQQLQKMAPLTEAGFYLVPKVIERE